MKNIKTVISSTIAITLTFSIILLAGCSLFKKDKPAADDNSLISSTDLSSASTTLEVIDPEDVEWNTDISKFINNDDLVNILLIGQDRRPDEGRQRSDAMILCSFNPQTNEASMISFLRDLYVQIPGYEDNRLNAAYVYCGFELLKETLNLNFGITVDGCLESDFEGFEKIIDTVGGIDIELTENEAEIVGGGATAGLCHLNGKQALTYARIRKIDSDFQRTARQRKIMTAVLEKTKTHSLAELAMFFGEIMPLMSTDMTEDEIMSLALTLAPLLSELETESYAVPSAGTYKDAMIRGMAVKVPDLPKIQKLIFEEYLPL